MFAATVAGIYEKVEDAMHAMGHGFNVEYQPDPAHAAIYAKRYEQYKKFGAFIETQTTSAPITKPTQPEVLLA
jgi:L-ribulokinase